MEEYKFHQNKNLISMNNIDINEMVVSNNLSFGKQEYLIGYKDDKKIKPLCIYIIKMDTYKSFDKNKCIYFLIKKKKFLINIMKFGEKLAI